MSKGLIETISLIDDISAVFDDPMDDIFRVKKVQKASKEIRALVRQREAVIKKAIRAYSSRVSNLQRQAENPVGKQLAAQQQTVKLQQEATKEDIAQLQENVRVQESNMASINHETSKLDASKQELDSKIEEALPFLRFQFILYKKVAPITWNTSTSNEDTKGHVHLINKQRVAPFSLKGKDGLSECERADRLWDTLWMDYEEEEF